MARLIVGPAAAVLYAIIAFTGAMTLALAAQRVGIEAHLKPLATLPSEALVANTVAAGSGAGVPDAAGPASTAPSCSTEQPPWQGLRSEIAAASLAAFALLRSVAFLLLAGVATGLIIEAAITTDDVAGLTGNHNALAIPIAAGLATPLCFHTSLFVPIADALSNAGVGIGAIVALAIAGAGANIPEFIILNKLADKRLIVIFFGYVFSVALTGGLLAQLVLG